MDYFEVYSKCMTFSYERYTIIVMYTQYKIMNIMKLRGIFAALTKNNCFLDSILKGLYVYRTLLQMMRKHVSLFRTLKHPLRRSSPQRMF